MIDNLPSKEKEDRWGKKESGKRIQRLRKTLRQPCQIINFPGVLGMLMHNRKCLKSRQHRIFYTYLVCTSLYWQEVQKKVCIIIIISKLSERMSHKFFCVTLTWQKLKMINTLYTFKLAMVPMFSTMLKIDILLAVSFPRSALKCFLSFY